jgi:ChrR Cupin-like domain
MRKLEPQRSLNTDPTRMCACNFCAVAVLLRSFHLPYTALTFLSCVSHVSKHTRRKFPEHTHIGGEEFLVLEGTFKDQFGSFPAGTYVRNPIGSKHAPWVDEDGCTILVKLFQMADTGEGTTPLHVHCDVVKQTKGQNTDFGTAVELYSNPQTGEIVQMIWLDADQPFPVDDLCCGGEELFVVSGSLLLDKDTYRRWGWLRFPVQGDPHRGSLAAGEQGAQVYRKTGHLTEQALSMEKIQIQDDETVQVI